MLDFCTFQYELQIYRKPLFKLNNLFETDKVCQNL